MAMEVSSLQSHDTMFRITKNIVAYFDVWDTRDIRMGHYVITHEALGTLAWDTRDTPYKRTGHSHGTPLKHCKGVTGMSLHCHRGVTTVL